MEQNEIEVEYNFSDEIEDCLMQNYLEERNWQKKQKYMIW